jgi:hypothetical protein
MISWCSMYGIMKEHKGRCKINNRIFNFNKNKEFKKENIDIQGKEIFACHCNI